MYVYLFKYCLCCNYILIKDSVFAFICPRGLFTFLFEQNLFSSYDFRYDFIEARMVMADFLLKWFSLLHCAYTSQGYTVGTAIFGHRQTCKIEHLQSIYLMMEMQEITKMSFARVSKIINITKVMLWLWKKTLFRLLLFSTNIW